MRTLDINTNYSDHGGGIRTYHQAKIGWFNRQRRHRYYLIVPGPRAAVRRLGPRTVRIDVFGAPLGCHYRFLLDYVRVLAIVRRLRPAVVEAGDPFLTGLVCLAAFRWGLLPGRLTAFYHSDPIETWVRPWARRGSRYGWRQPLAALASGLFYALQRGYERTIVTSRTMEEHLRSRGVSQVVRQPFGVDPLFLNAAEPAGVARSVVQGEQPVRLLFVGRLIQDKAAEVLLAALPRILSLPQVRCTIIGGGPLEAGFRAIVRPGYHFLGYVRDRRQMAELYRQHDVLLAPGPYETFGLAVLEAMASGLTVVGPDRGGTAELLAEARSPFVFRAGDVDDFVRVVQSAVAADLSVHAAAARAVACGYGTWDEAMGRLVAYYENLATGRPTELPATRLPNEIANRMTRLDAPAGLPRSSEHFAEQGERRNEARSGMRGL